MTEKKNLTVEGGEHLRSANWTKEAAWGGSPVSVSLPRAYLSDFPTGVNRGLPGGGPWRILPECPGLLHNTMRAAERGKDGKRCICPRAVLLWDAEKERRRLIPRKPEPKGARQERRRRSPKAPTRKPMLSFEKAPKYMSNVATVARPALRFGLCRDEVGAEIIDNAQKRSGMDPGYGVRLQQARKMCGMCVEQPVCAAWILKAERPGGSWDAFYAGMTPKEREKRGIKG